MNTIAITTEESLDYEKLLSKRMRESSGTIGSAIAHATCSLAMEMNANAIITASASGETPRALATYKPRVPVVAVTPYESTARRLSLCWGVYPVLGHEFKSTDEMFESCVAEARKNGFVGEGDLAVLTAGVPIGLAGSTNLLKVETVGSILIKGRGTCVPSVITGRIKVIKDVEELLDDFQDGDVLVTNKTNDLMNSFIEKASAVITEDGNLSGHAVIMGMKYAKPVVVNAKRAMSILKDGGIVTINGKTGVIVKGKAHL